MAGATYIVTCVAGRPTGAPADNAANQIEIGFVNDVTGGYLGTTSHLINSLPSGSVINITNTYTAAAGVAGTPVTIGMDDNYDQIGGDYVLDNVQVMSVSIIYPPAAAPAFSSASYANNQLTFTVTGTAGSNYVVQATTNLNPVVWASIATNTAPFVFTDTDAGFFSRRFYRSEIH